MLQALRSYLFVPADSEKKIAKALTGLADAIILDLEDGVALGNKAAARVLCLQTLQQPRTKPMVVRVNALDSGQAQRDLLEVMPGRPDAIMLPKCCGQSDLDTLSHYLDLLEFSAGIPQGSTKVIPIVTETGEAVMALSSYRKGSDRLVAMLWGGEDLASSLGAITNRAVDGSYTAPYALARSMCLMTASGLGIAAIDAVYPVHTDEPGLKDEILFASRDGYAAKAAIHPGQIAPINAGFTPTDTEITEAQEIVALLSNGEGVAVLNGRLIEAPHLKRAEKILARKTLFAS